MVTTISTTGITILPILAIVAIVAAVILIISKNMVAKKLSEICLKLIGSFLVGFVLAMWFGLDPGDSGFITKVIFFAIGLTLITLNLNKEK